MPTVFEGGPYLNAALLCERTIQENDGVLTLVRAIDKVIAAPVEISGQLQPFMVSLSLAVVLKSGTARGEFVLVVHPQQPDGSYLPRSETAFSLTGTDDGQGANVVINMNLGVHQEGMYWFDILLDAELLTRVPLRIEYQRAGDQTPPAPPAPASAG
jgi:hypothetical protein